MKRVLSILFFVCQFTIMAQVFPVQISSNVNPPYLPSIASYATVPSQNYLVNIFTADLSVVNRPAKLKLYIEGNGITASSKPIVVGAPNIILNGGETLNLSNLDLAPYFQLENLNGISPQQYSSNLPQGSYNFCFEVFDVTTNQKISQKTCASFYFMYNEPPFLNVPNNNSVVQFQEPTNILFTWTPRHINATNIEYHFKLVEVLDNLDPNIVILAPNAIYETITDNTVLNYDMSLPQLLEGKKYAWRVQARQKTGFGQYAVFNNNGYSPVYTFSYPGSCLAPSNVITTSLSATSTQINWGADPKNIDFVVEYRKQGTQDWFTVSHANNTAVIHGLEASNTYEFRVGGKCMGNVIVYSQTNTFTQPVQNQVAVNCGIAPTINLTNVKLFTNNLVKNDAIVAGDFTVFIISSTVSGDKHSGEGYVKVPYLNSARVAVEFKDIKINSDKKLVDGFILFKYDKDWKNRLDINMLVKDIKGLYDTVEDSFDALSPDVEENIEQVNFPASTVTVANGQITVTGANGQTETFDQDKKEINIITDSNGNVWGIPAGESTATLLQAGGGFIPNEVNTKGVGANGQVTAITAPNGAKVTFSRANEAAFGDDQYNDSYNGVSKLREKYKTIKTADNKEYELFYKYVVNDGKATKSTDKIKATVSGNIDKSKIVFNLKGVRVGKDAQFVGNSIILDVPVFESSSETELMAIYDPDGRATANESTTDSNTPNTNANFSANKEKSSVLGVAKIIAAKAVNNVQVVLVPVNGAYVPSEKDIQNKLDAIYKQAGVTFTVTKANNYVATKKTLDFGEDYLLENYTPDMREFQNTYEKSSPNNKFDSKKYYLFVMKDIKPSKSIGGFMPLHRQYGFIFAENDSENNNNTKVATTTNNKLAEIVAHELGHGVFELEHPWTEYNANQSSTNWLMDYSSGTHIPYMQVQKMSHPKFGVYIFQDMESGELAGGYALTPDFKFIKSSLSTALSGSNIAPEGFISGFEDKIGDVVVNYLWDGQSKYVATYQEGKETKTKVYTNYQVPESNSIIWLFYDNNNSCNDRKYIKTLYSIIANKNYEELKQYIQSIKNNESLKKKDKDERSIYWAALPCDLSKEGNGNEASGDYYHYISGLAKNAGKKYTEDNTDIGTQSTHLFDYATLISKVEKEKILKELNIIQQREGILCKIFFVDSETPQIKKDEVNTYLTNLKGKEIDLLIDFTNKDNPVFKTYLGSDIKGRDDQSFNEYVELLSKAVESIRMPGANFNPITAMLDGIAGLIGKLAIPRRFYNPDDPEYNPLPAEVYSYFSLSVVYDELNKAIINGKEYTEKYKFSRVQFAFVCGVWNGFVDLVVAVPQGISLLKKIDNGIFNLIINKDNARQNFVDKISKLSWSSIENHIQGEWKKATDNACLVSHTSGKIVFTIASCFIGAGEANMASKFLTTINELDVIGQIFGKFMQIASPYFKIAVSGIGKITVQPLLKLEPAISKELRTLLANNVKKIILQPSKRITISFHATDTGKFLVDGLELTSEELGELLTKKLSKQEKEIVLLSCNDLASAKSLSEATGKIVYTTDGAITIFENGIKRADDTNWYKVEPNGTATKVDPPVNECTNCTGDGVEMGGNTAGKVVDDIAITSKELQYLQRFKNKFTSLTDDEFIRAYRRIENAGFDVRGLLQKNQISDDIVRLEKLISYAKKDVQKIGNLFSKNLLSGGYNQFIELVDIYIPAFQKIPVSNVKPNYFSQVNRVFDDINMQHIMDKHSIECFDFTVNGVSNDIDMFPIGTTQQQVSTYIDEALTILKNTKGANYPLNKNPELVKLSNGMEVYIGSDVGSNILTAPGVFPDNANIIGQFYPKSGTGGITVKSSILKILNEIQ